MTIQNKETPYSPYENFDLKNPEVLEFQKTLSQITVPKKNDWPALKKL